MNVSEVMSDQVYVLAPRDSVTKAALLMKKYNVGIVPVAEDDKLVGMVTDRDLVIRGLAEARESSTELSEVMSDNVYYVYADTDTEEVAKNMAKLQVNRMPVVDRDKQLVGMVSLGDLGEGIERDTLGYATAAIKSD